MSYKQLDALSGTCVWQKQLVKASVVLRCSAKELKTPLPHLSESHIKELKIEGFPTLLLPNSCEQDGKRRSKPVRSHDDSYLAQEQKGDG